MQKSICLTGEFQKNISKTFCSEITFLHQIYPA